MYVAQENFRNKMHKKIWNDFVQNRGQVRH